MAVSTAKSDGMTSAGFETAGNAKAEPPRVVLGTTGQEKRGKTHFALTAPGPVAVIAIDAGTMEVARKISAATGKQIYVKQVASAKTLAQSRAGIDKYVEEWESIKQAVARIILNDGIRTIVYDTITELWELCRLARFGKLAQVMPQHYGPVNQEFRESIVKLPYERPGLNAVMVHKSKKQYATNREGKDAWNGKWEPGGFSDTLYTVDTVIEHTRLPREEIGCEFSIKVVDDRLNPADNIGRELTGDECAFPYLAAALRPETTFDYWE